MLCGRDIAALGYLQVGKCFSYAAISPLAPRLLGWPDVQESCGTETSQYLRCLVAGLFTNVALRQPSATAGGGGRGCYRTVIGGRRVFHLSSAFAGSFSVSKHIGYVLEPASLRLGSGLGICVLPCCSISKCFFSLVFRQSAVASWPCLAVVAGCLQGGAAPRRGPVLVGLEKGYLLQCCHVFAAGCCRRAHAELGCCFGTSALLWICLFVGLTSARLRVCV